MTYDLLTAAGWRSVLADLRGNRWAKPWRFWWRDTLTRFTWAEIVRRLDEHEDRRRQRVWQILQTYAMTLPDPDENPH